MENSGQNQANTRAEDTPSGGAVTPPPGAGQTGSSLSLPFSLTMARGSLKNTYIRFADHSVTPSFSTEISPLDLEIEDLAAGPGGVTGAYTLSFLSEARENLESRGRFSAKGELSLESTLSVRGIRPDKYRPYYGAWIGPGLSLGRADLETGVHLVLAHGAPRVKIRDGRLGLADIRITETAQNADILSVKGITASGIQGDSDQKRLRLKALVARDGHMNLERDKTGGLNILKALAIMPGPGSKELPDPASPGDAGGPWTLNLERFSLENHGLDFLDRQPGEPVRLAASDIRVTAEGLSTLPSENHGRIQAAMTLGEKGKIGIAGDIGLTRSGAALNLDLNLEKIDITPFKPYIPDHVRLGITQGHIRSKGQVALSVKPDQLPKIQFTGRAALNEFVSRVDETDFFTCRSLSLEGMDVSVFPARIHIKEVALTDFFQKAVFSPSGGFNIGRAFAPQEAGGPKKGGDPGEAGGSGKSGPPELDIGAVTLQGGRIHFADYYHAPKFTADMTEISGSIEALSSLPGKGPARLSLKGTYGSQAPLDISGTLDPFKPQPEMDLALSFKNIELVNFTPYAEKYLGYGIEKGKLVLDLKYNIREGRLTSRNHLFFDQFTLGAGVESPDATNLPVPLAISLLKNTRDEIDLDLPIQGNLTDPEFSYGSVVGNAFTNLILGVVTAPFKFLGGIVGLGDSMDLGHVAFSPGQDILIPSEKEKIDHLARILTEKDGLKLEIIGTYHSLRDGEGLQVEKFKRQLARMASGSTGGPTDRILEDLTPEARDRLVAAAWAAADFPKPKLPSGREKKLTIQEKETLLITAAEVDEGELKALALRRSRNIRDYMVGSGKIDPHRIFINDPDPAQDTPGPGVNTLFVLK